MTINNSIDWKQLNGKHLKIYVTEQHEAVIGIDEESGKSYILRQEQPMILNFAESVEPIKKRGWL